MVTVPPCLCVVDALPVAVGLVLGVPFDWHAVNTRPNAMRTAMVLERLILTVPSSSVALGSRGPWCRREWRCVTHRASPVVRGSSEWLATGGGCDDPLG